MGMKGRDESLARGVRSADAYTAQPVLLLVMPNGTLEVGEHSHGAQWGSSSRAASNSLSSALQVRTDSGDAHFIPLGSPTAVTIPHEGGATVKVERILTKYAKADDYAYSTPGFLVSAGRLLFMQGQVAWDDETNIVSDEFGVQARKAFENLGAIVESAGGTLENIVHMLVFLSDLDDFDEFMAIRREFYPYGSLPPASVVGAKLVSPIKVEIHATAAFD